MLKSNLAPNSTGALTLPLTQELRLLVIGENLNECGGFDTIQLLTALAKKEILSGRRRVRFDNDFKKYPGSILWHRLGCYAVAFAEAKGVLNPYYIHIGQV